MAIEEESCIQMPRRQVVSNTDTLKLDDVKFSFSLIYLLVFEMMMLAQ